MPRFLIVVFLVLAQVARPAPALELHRRLQETFEDSKFSNAHWGVLVQSIDSGEVLYALNERRLFMPASNMKLLTAAAAFLRLGFDYRFKTALYATGPIEDGVLEGDLVIVGSGDPTIGGRPLDENYDDIDKGDPLRDFKLWAAALRQLGISRIGGRIVADDREFDDIQYGQGWSWDYLQYAYAAEVSALQFNENAVTISLAPARQEEAARLDIWPPNRHFEVVSEVTTGPAEQSSDVDMKRSLNSNRIVLRGRVAESRAPFVFKTTAVNASLYFVRVLRQTLESEGIQVVGEAVDCDEIDYARQFDAWTRLYTHESPLLDYVLKVLLKRSQNLYAESLLKRLGVEISGEGSAAAGQTVVESILEEFSIPEDQYVLADGSGLSRLNLVSPELLVRLLRGLYAHPRFDLFYEQLPVGGVDGTLRSRMVGTAAAGNVRAKTGSIGYARTLSGYVRTRDNETLVFAMLANHFTAPTSAAEDLQDRAVELLANFSRH